MADTGWLNFNTPSETGSGAAWTNSGRIVSEDGLSATVTWTYTTGPTKTLLVTNTTTGASTVPGGNSVLGIEVRVKCNNDTVGGSYDTVFDSSVRLFVGGVAAGTDKSTGAALPSGATPTFVTWGGPTDLWGLTPSLAQVNATGSQFGFQWKANHPGGSAGSASVAVDVMQMRIYYGVGGGPTFIARQQRPIMQAVNRASTY